MMDQRITVLPPLLANQLAAGEVIERPASIVKELVENSLDAGATELTITLVDGGIKRIQITDNGSGIHPDDLSLAFARHATSKIKTAADLSQIASLGFRGEALASIGSVAKLRIASSWGDEPAHEASISASQTITLQLCSHPRGTTVEVNDLFYNTPARKKFLKSARTEWLHIEDLIKRLSLSRPDVSWHIYHDGKLTTRYIAKPRDMRLQQVLGKSFIDAGITIDATITQVKLSGMIAKPEFARSSNDYQFFYVNGRMVKDRVISHAIRQAYEDKIYPGRYPAYVLYCDVDHHQVDVNVHPTKHEVRFVHARLVHDFISQTLLNTLQGIDANPQVIPKTVSHTVHQATIFQQALYQVEPRLCKHPLPLGSVIGCLGERVVMTQQHEILYAIDWQKSLQQYGLARWQEGLDSGALAMLPLLEPWIVTKVDIQGLMEPMQALGFELQALREDQCALRAMPACLTGLKEDLFKAALIESTVDFMSAVVKAWAQSQARDIHHIEDLIAQMVAFKGEKSVVYRRHAPETLLA